MRLNSSFQTKIVNKEIALEQVHPLNFTHKIHHKLSTYVRSGLRIARASINNEKPLDGSEEEIITQIHTIRYNKENPYVITGGHFSQLFVRNLGVFFNALLDPRIPSTQEDWIMRQSIALKTIAHDLETFKLAGREFTTITPVKQYLYTGLDLYARPSDSLHAIMYTLHAMIDDKFISELFPCRTKNLHTLQTKSAARKLIKDYKKILVSLLQKYKEDLLDDQTGLVKKDLLLASARDGIKRQSSFYDNVILWSTLRLAAKLALYTISEKELQTLKSHILKTFWHAEEGIFLDDLSERVKKKKLFSADSFIVTSTGFLHYKKKSDRKYLEHMVSYVKRNQLDTPFPLHYSTEDTPHLLYHPVRHFAPSYMGTSIWCHWGMEYIKILILLSKENPKFLNDSKKHLLSYKNNIEKYGGYPETYDKKGHILSTRLYRSVLYNGWVINYEQAKMLYKNAVT